MQGVSFSGTDMEASLTDGQRISVPLDWFPRLEQATERERSNWRLIGTGEGIHWPDLDEDISLAGLRAGQRSAETRKPLQG